MNENSPLQGEAPGRPETGLRLFVALPVVEPVKQELSLLQERLRQAARRARIRWSNVGQSHLTLKFIGEVEASGVPALSGALHDHCAKIEATRLEARGVGFFPNARSPRVVWAGVRDVSGNLLALHQAVERAFSALSTGPPESESGFEGHLTLGRIKTIARDEAQALARLANTFAIATFGTWVASEIVLFRSELSAEGPRHSALARIQLAPR